MKKEELEKLRQKTKEELESILQKEKRELKKLIVELKVSKLKDVSRIGQKKRDIAQIITIMKEAEKI